MKGVFSFREQGRRPADEDHLFTDEKNGIFVVADGFGGPGPGTLAAKTACEAVQSFLIKEAGDLEATMPFVLRSYYSLAANVLFNSLIHANRTLIEQNRGKTGGERGGASIIAAFMDNDLLAIANIGACTAWLFRDDKAVELVIPRTYDRLIDPFMSLNSLNDSRQPKPGVPLMSLGLAEDLEPEMFEYKIRERDWLLLHTDGMTSKMHGDIKAIHQQRHADITTAKEAVANAIKTAAAEGLHDNLAATLVFF
ncbi:MAG: PP2C family protein-serine/threonine phosphatase [Bdellovibrionota bacterium]